MAEKTCHCGVVRPFTPGVRLALLLHPREAKKSVGTARIIRRCMPEVPVITGRGPELDRSQRLLSLLADKAVEPFVLFPGKAAADLGELSPGGTAVVFDPARVPLIFVIDGTWKQAEKMLRDSVLLKGLRQLSFRPSRVSTYRFRRQPALNCLSSVEAIHELLDRLGALGVSRPENRRAHDNLLEVFQVLVERQVRFAEERMKGEKSCQVS